MTPKEEYEARRATRRKAVESEYTPRERAERSEYMALLDMADRFVTAVERIADALEAPRNDPA